MNYDVSLLFVNYIDNAPIANNRNVKKRSTWTQK